MSKDCTNEVGYESLLSDFKRYQAQTPKGVRLTKKGQNIYLQFKTPNKTRGQHSCSCTFTLDGMVSALSKSHKVAEKLKTLNSEVEFWEWYEKEIKQNNEFTNDRLTFGEAIAIVEENFWSRPDRRGYVRIKGHPSYERSYYNTYDQYFRKLDKDKKVTVKHIIDTLNTWKKGDKTFKDALSAFKKLARLCGNKGLIDALKCVDGKQTNFKEKQEIDLETFMEWRLKVLGISEPLSTRVDLETRRKGLWVLGMQIVYGLRISEVFAIKNLKSKTYDEKGKFCCYPYNDTANNPHRLIYIGKFTNLGTTVKTGARLARPMLSVRYPNLYTDWELEVSRLPDNKPLDDSGFNTVSGFHGRLIRGWLAMWNAPFTQTHADRRLGNLLGEISGVPQEIRARSMGHTVTSNDRHYKTGSYQTQIDLLTQSNSNAIDFVTALSSVKNLLKTQPENRNFAAKLLSIIYQKNEDELLELL